MVYEYDLTCFFTMHDDSEPKEEVTTEPSKQYGISDPAVLAEWLIN